MKAFGNFYNGSIVAVPMKDTVDDTIKAWNNLLHFLRIKKKDIIPQRLDVVGGQSQFLDSKKTIEKVTR